MLRWSPRSVFGDESVAALGRQRLRMSNSDATMVMMMMMLLQLSGRAEMDASLRTSDKGWEWLLVCNCKVRQEEKKKGAKCKRSSERWPKGGAGVETVLGERGAGLEGTRILQTLSDGNVPLWKVDAQRKTS